MDTNISTAEAPITITPTTTTAPSWLGPSLQLLCGFAGVTQSKPLKTFALAYALYFFVYYSLNRPTVNGDYMAVYIFGTTLFNQTWRIACINFLQDATEFQRSVPANEARAIAERKKNDAATVTKEVSRDGRSSKTVVEGRKKQRRVLTTVLDALELGFMTARGVGWNFRVRISVPGVPPTYPRWKFVRDMLRGALWRVLAIDLASSYIRSTPLGTLPVTQRMQDMPRPHGLFLACILYTTSRWTMELLFSILAAVSVGTGLHDPAKWPPLFGPLREAYTVRRFWKFTWHQMMRGAAAPPSRWLVRSVLKLRKGSFASNYAQVLVAFSVAYALHGYASFIAGGDHSGDLWYYMQQVLVIFVEDQAVLLGKRVGFQDAWYWRGLGYVWMATVRSHGLMYWQDHAAVRGAFVKSPLGFSLVDRVRVRYGW